MKQSRVISIFGKMNKTQPHPNDGWRCFFMKKPEQKRHAASKTNSAPFEALFVSVHKCDVFNSSERISFPNRAEARDIRRGHDRAFSEEQPHKRKLVDNLHLNLT